MRWYKHYSNLRNSQGGAYLLDHGGIEAYGAFCMICEIVAEHMGPQGAAGCSHTLSPRRWAKALGVHPNKVGKLLTIIRDSGLGVVRTGPDAIEIAIPKLAEWRDEYSRKSGQGPNGIRTLSQRSEAEKDKETDQNLRSDRAVCEAARQPPSSPSGRAHSEAAVVSGQGLAERTDARKLRTRQDGLVHAGETAQEMLQRLGRLDVNKARS